MRPTEFVAVGKVTTVDAEIDDDATSDLIIN